MKSWEAPDPKTIKARRLEAEKVLRAHVLDRHLRSAVKAQDISGELSAQPRMQEEPMVEHQALCRGIPEETLKVLHMLWVESPGPVPRMMLVSDSIEVAQEWVAGRYSRRQVARRFGLTAGVVDRMVQEAYQIVADRITPKRLGKVE